MYAFRDRMAKELGLDLLVHINPDGVAKGINPFTHGSPIHTDVMKTEGLKQALDKYGFDAAFGGARRDEEKSRAKERIFSFRTAQHRWDPKSQRPELWHLYNARKHKGESMRVFPHLQLDRAGHLAVHLPAEHPDRAAVLRGRAAGGGARRHADHGGRRPHAAAPRRDADDEEGALPHARLLPADRRGRVRRATTLPEIIQEMLLTTTSERQGRMIDHDSAGSMEKKKQEGYF